MQNDFDVEIKVTREKALYLLDEQITQGKKYSSTSDYDGRAAWNERNKTIFSVIFKNSSPAKSYPATFNKYSEADVKACLEYLKLLRSLIDILPNDTSNLQAPVQNVSKTVSALNKGSSTSGTAKQEAKKEVVELSDTDNRNSHLPSYSVFGVPNKKYTYDLFVLMPFTESLKPVYEYILKKVAKTLKLSIARADDFNSLNSIMQHEIWSAINLASIIIADCTGKNPNVFYEIGIAHTIGKPVILVTQNQDDIPFDLRHIRYIKYELTKPGMIKFESTLTTTIVEIIKDIGGSKNK